MAKKLTKDQRDIIAECLAVIPMCGNVKPVTVAYLETRAILDQYSASYARYCRQMFALEDAGILTRERNTDGRDSSLAYIVPARAAAVYHAGVLA